MPIEPAERKKMHFNNGEPELCMRDSDRHMIVIACGQQLPLLARVVLRERELVSNYEKALANKMRGFGYKLEGFSERQVGGKTAICFRYTYLAEGIPMEGESCFIRDGKLMYNLYVYYREQLREDSVATWESILDTVSWEVA